MKSPKFEYNTGPASMSNKAQSHLGFYGHFRYVKTKDMPRFQTLKSIVSQEATND